MLKVRQQTQGQVDNPSVLISYLELFPSWNYYSCSYFKINCLCLKIRKGNIFTHTLSYLILGPKAYMYVYFKLIRSG
jgi:hypothetical protein